MKTPIFSLSLLVVLALSAFTYLPAPVAFKIDTQASKMTWLAKKVTGQHNGTIKLSGGSLNVEGNVVKSGSVEIDMNSIVVEDIADKDMNAKLTGHLKEADFFDAAKYPKGKFEVTKMEPNKQAAGKNNYTVTGKLTLKGITKDVTFPATVVINGNKMTANAKFNLDRTQWDIRFNSGKFFPEIGDKMIYDEFEVGFDLVATK
jgi:polyisoprenoid-binding protein YceI